MTHAPIPDEETAQAGFSKIYAEESPPWDIGKPQPPFIAVADRIKGPLLDCGCGTGGTAVYFAERGLKVTGIDFVEQAIQRAAARAKERGAAVEFLVKDAMTLSARNRRFESVIDSGLFHIYDGKEREQYVRGLANVLVHGGRLFLFSFADCAAAPGGGVSRQAMHEAFADALEIESLDYADGEMNPNFPHPEQLDGLKMWFAIIRRKVS